MKYFENQQAEHDVDDDLPFALSQDEQLQLPQCIPHESTVSTLCSSSYDTDEPFHEASSIALPQLASSILSSPTDGESHLSSSSAQNSALNVSESLFLADSRCLDAAASLLFTNSSLNLTMSSLPRSQPSRNSLDSTYASSSTNGMDLSHLLKQAEASVRSPRSVIRALPVLPEETSTGCPLTPPANSPTITSPRARPPLSMSLMQSQATILEGMPSTYADQRLASLAGATARRTSGNSFVVVVELSGDESKVVDILGNLTVLSMWCDAVPSLIVTDCSETSRGMGTEGGREYDAEWMEATCPYLIPPPNSSCIYSLVRTVQSSLGFPNFGRVTLLVERQRGQVALTIGTFDGGIDIYHKLQIQPLVGGKVRVTDEVRLHYQDEGTWSSLRSVFLPDLGDYMNQAISSMARLRFLVERDETCGYTPPLLAAAADMEPLLSV